MDVLLAIDLGTEGARVGAFDGAGRLLADAHEGYDTVFPRPGWAEQDPEDWWHATVRAARAVLANDAVARAGAVVGISVATTASTVVVLDSAGRPLRPAILWMDSRASAEATETGEHADAHPVLAYSGGIDSAEWLVPKAMWLARNEPRTYAEAHRVVEAVDYLTWRLTGRWVASLMNATCKWNYDSRVGRFPTELYADLGIESLTEKLPADVLPVGEPCGSLQASAARDLGVTGRPVVATGGIDAHVSLLACGEQVPGLVSVVAGTSTVFVTEVPDPLHSPAIWGPYPHALRPGHWLLEGGQVSSGSVLSWLSQAVLGTQRTELPQLVEAAAGVPPVHHGLMVLDHFMGNRTPYRDPRLRGAVLGLTLGTTAPELYRATLEAVCLGTRNVLESWTQAGVPIGRIVLSGGVRHNPLWLATTADVLGRPLELVQADNLTLRSGAVQAAHAAGLFPDITSASLAYAPATHTVEPDLRLKTDYDEAFERYTSVTLAMREQLHDLADVADLRRTTRG